MSYLFLVSDSFELSNIPREERDEIFASFCKAVSLAQRQGDTLFGTNDLQTRNYSYGSFFWNFLYGGWESIDADPNLNGISNVTHSLYTNLLYAMPGLVTEIESLNQFAQMYADSHNGHLGFKTMNAPVPYISCFRSFNVWKCPWLSLNQDAINWEGVTNIFLPNSEYSEMILKDEIELRKKQLQIQGKEKELSQLKEMPGDIALVFHNGVVRHKGADIGTYAREVGGKVLEANYYQFDPELTKAEREASNNRRRYIYKLLNRNEEYQYVSIDHGHGMFEYHNSKGEHLGENRFDGGYNSGSEVDHNLRTL